MTLDEAREYVRVNRIKGEVIIATSEGQVYINPNISFLEKIAEEVGLELLYIKPEKPEVPNLKPSKNKK